MDNLSGKLQKLFKGNKENKVEEEYPVRPVSVEEVRRGIQNLANSLPMGVSIRSFIKHDHSVDFELLKPVLKAVPDRKFYMSKETFEVFEDAETPKTMDQVQLAVDQYIKANGELPVVQGDPTHKVSYFLIKDYLRVKPSFDLYLDEKDHLVMLEPNGEK
ncbi:DUF3939 domain-containing protein [Thalassorhabdus alkalitolerans]|uniref:DUF3939 domain-containing protein n=1 Tax=Thalassorhabdus alkalitolerans TaxID=2282697 RepID=A0ABW0YPJ7_9BACI|nr:MULTISPECIES: DUF3939 domain-containing protein [Bacillaceae]